MAPLAILADYCLEMVSLPIIHPGEEHGFDAPAFRFERGRIGRRQHGERLVKNDVDPAERLGNDKAVPGIQAPCRGKAHVDRDDGGGVASAIVTRPG